MSASRSRFNLLEAARYLGVTARAARNYIDMGLLPASWSGGRYAIERADLDALVEALPKQFPDPPSGLVALPYELRLADCGHVLRLIRRYKRAVSIHSVEGLSLILDGRWPGAFVRRDLGSAFDNVILRCPEVDRGLLAGALIANAIEELGGSIPSTRSRQEP